jgi:hypothetical protein
MKALADQESYFSYYSVINGKNNGSALDVYMDVIAHTLAQPRQGSMVRVFGVSKSDIAQFTYLTQINIEVHAGMNQPGLPLSKQFTPDLLLRGSVFAASGNWEGTNMSLDLACVPLFGLGPEADQTVQDSRRLMLQWPRGENLKSAIQAMLDATYAKSPTNPNGYNVEIYISDQLISKGGDTEYAANLSGMAKKIKEMTTTRSEFKGLKTVDGEDYPGVDFKVVNKTITVFDNTVDIPTRQHDSKKPILIQFQDMIGQPTWKSAVLLSFKTVLRADIEVNDFVKLPTWLGPPYVLNPPNQGQQGAPNTPTGVGLPSRNANAFEGTYQILEVHHNASFRQADGRSWITSFDAAYKGRPAQVASGNPVPLFGSGSTAQPQSPSNNP